MAGGNLLGNQEEDDDDDDDDIDDDDDDLLESLNKVVIEQNLVSWPQQRHLKSASKYINPDCIHILSVLLSRKYW